MEIRVARAEDAGACLSIYAPYVEWTAITFDYEVPSLESFRRHITETLRRYPFLIAEEDGTVLGYAYTGVFKNRRAYDWSVEVSVYVDRTKRRRGIGKKLYQALEAVSREQHLLNINACIARPKGNDPYLDTGSERFHSAMGYSLVGVFHDSGYKFERWYDMVWMEKMLDSHPGSPQKPILFEDLPDAALQRAGISGRCGK